MSKNHNLWSFEKIAAQDADRAARLQDSPSWTDLMRKTCYALNNALSKDNARIGLDEFTKNTHYLRIVVQFHVGKQLFDWFFNSCAGYRAQFRLGWENGLIQNAQLITMLKSEIKTCVPGEVSVPRLNLYTGKYCGTMLANVQDILASLDSFHSKLWCCDGLIEPSGVVKNLNVFRTDAKLVLGECEQWPSIYADEDNAWVDLKGAYNSGLYQHKDPVHRAKELQQRGTA